MKPALSEKAIPTSNRWTEKEPERRHDIIRGTGPSAIDNKTKGEHGPRHNKHGTITTTIQRLLHAQIKYVPQPWRLKFPSGKTRRKTKSRKNT